MSLETDLERLIRRQPIKKFGADVAHHWYAYDCLVGFEVLISAPKLSEGVVISCARYCERCNVPLHDQTGCIAVDGRKSLCFHCWRIVKLAAYDSHDPRTWGKPIASSGPDAGINSQPPATHYVDPFGDNNPFNTKPLVEAVYAASDALAICSLCGNLRHPSHECPHCAKNKPLAEYASATCCKSCGKVSNALFQGRCASCNF
jgi:hypothetical protein